MIEKLPTKKEDECKQCNGLGFIQEMCCKDLSTAVLNHCGCNGHPQYKMECECQKGGGDD